MDFPHDDPKPLAIRFFQVIAIVLTICGFLVLMYFVSQVLKGSPDGSLGEVFRIIAIVAALLLTIPVVDHMWNESPRTSTVVAIALWTCATIALVATANGGNGGNGAVRSVLASAIIAAVPAFSTLGAVGFFRDRMRNGTLRLSAGIAAAICLAAAAPIVGILSSCVLLNACL